MKILYCNKYNFEFSGTEAHLFEVMHLMRANGHETALFSMLDERGAATPYDRYFVSKINFHDRGLPLTRRLQLAARAVYSTDAQNRIKQMLDEFRPDVAHIRNIYHHLSPSILWELRAQRIPVIYHLNDFKVLCPNRNFVANGRSCEKCAGGKFWRVVIEGCHEGPVGTGFVLAAEAYTHHWLRTYQKCVSMLLAPSEFARQKLSQYGWPLDEIKVLPHFQRLPHVAGSAEAGTSILYFGRLSAEKGVDDLLRAMQLIPEITLDVAGDGPQRAELESLARELGLANVRFLGHVGRGSLPALITKSRVTVFPSRAYEILGKSILESYACARPVVASDLGSRRELVKDGETGYLFPVGDAERMAEAIERLFGNAQLPTKWGPRDASYCWNATLRNGSLPR